LCIFNRYLLRDFREIFIRIYFEGGIFAAAFVMYGRMICISVMITSSIVHCARLGLAKNSYAFNFASAKVKAHRMADRRSQHKKCEDACQYGAEIFQMVCKYTRLFVLGSYIILVKSYRIRDFADFSTKPERFNNMILSYAKSKRSSTQTDESKFI